MEATGDDGLEAVEVRRDVERRPVRRHPARDAHPERRQFPVPNPDAGRARQSPRSGNSVRGGAAYDCVLQSFNIRSCPAAQATHVDHRVSYKLTRAVEGYVAPSVRVVERSACGSQILG